MTENTAAPPQPGGDHYEVKNVSGVVAIGPGARAELKNYYQFTRPAAVDPATLDQALTRLASLPTDAVPDPAAALPPGSRMPLGQNPLFVGRAVELLRLANLIKDGATTVIATGIGGMGKSQLASEFVHRYGSYFAGGVYWLSLADADAVAAQVALCGGSGGMNLRPDFDRLDLPAQVAAVLSAWQSPLPRLLVFDNCEAMALLQRWRPATGGCRVLVTSRQTEWPKSLKAAVQPVTTLARDAAVGLLAQHVPEADPAQLDAIAAAVGDLPLALHLAGSFLETYAGEPFATAAALLTQLQVANPLSTRALTGTGATPSATNHDLNVARTFALSWERLLGDDAINKTARWLLAAAAHLAPGEPIARELLDGTVTDGDEFVIAAAIKKLLAVGLLEREPDGRVKVHRLIASFVQHTAAESAATLAAVVQQVAEKAEALNDTGLPAPLQTWQAHLRHVALAAAAKGLENAGWLWSALGQHLSISGEYDEARAAFVRALALDEAAFGPDDPTVAITVNNLGHVLLSQEDYPAAQAAFARALAILEAVHGPDDPHVAIAVNNLGSIYLKQGDFTAAQAAFARALAIDKAAAGPDHPSVARDINNLGKVLQQIGDYDAARAAFTRALAILEAALGPEHPQVASAVYNLGQLLQLTGAHAEARQAMVRALATLERVLGPDHPYTERVRASLSEIPDT